MQRTLVLVRHAKSSWANPLQSDYDRPLNDRGTKDAPVMGERLKKTGLIPDLIVSSTAKRAVQTAKRLAEAIGYDPENIVWNNQLYHCIPSVFEEVIRDIDDNAKTLLIVAHNPGITQFVNELSKKFSIDNMPTCAMVAAHVKTKTWNDFANANKEVFYFDYPKKQS